MLSGCRREGIQLVRSWSNSPPSVSGPISSASAGQIRYDGLALAPDFRKRSKDELRKLQMIYQMPDTALNPRQRVREIIGRPLEFFLCVLVV